MFNVCAENGAMPLGQKCTYCFLSDVMYRCLQCGLFVYFCGDCLDLHSKNCICLTPELWTVMYCNRFNFILVAFYLYRREPLYLIAQKNKRLTPGNTIVAKQRNCIVLMKMVIYYCNSNWHHF